MVITSSAAAEQKPLNWRQESIMRAIRQSYHQNHRAPTVRDIQIATGISSTSVVDYNLGLLEGRGLIHVQPEIARGIELVLQPGDPCPCCGRPV